jgi:hypothetical protein
MNVISVARPSSTRTPGLLCLVGAVIGVISGLVTAFIPPAVGVDQYSYPYTPQGFRLAEAVFIVNHVLLLVGLLGLMRSGVTGSGRPGVIGLWIAVAGMIVLSLCEVAAMTLAESAYPTAETDLLDSGFGVSSIVIGLGLVLAGVAAVRAGRWEGAARFAPLACGLAVFLIVIPGIFGTFLTGRLAITAWMVIWGIVGVALMRRSS